MGPNAGMETYRWRRAPPFPKPSPSFPEKTLPPVFGAEPDGPAKLGRFDAGPHPNGNLRLFGGTICGRKI